MPGNFTAKALIMLNSGTNVLQSYGCCSVPLYACVEFNACASKRALARKSFWDEGLFERGGLLFENEIRNAYWWALRIEKPSRFEV